MFILCKMQRLPKDVYYRLEESFGKIVFKGQSFSFNTTDYYQKEFGMGLFRHVIAFNSLMDPGKLMSYKKIAFHIEKDYSSDNRRLYNFDIGYLDTDKLVLASFKQARNKVYLGEGVYADILLQYEKGRFFPLVNTFGDFLKDQYYKDLLVIREKLKSDLKKMR